MSQKSPQDSKPAGKAADKAESSDRLPFEPAQSRKKTPKKLAAAPVIRAKDPSIKPTPQALPKAAAGAIPEVVSKRMARRMGFFCGIPTSFGMLTFIVSYILVSQHLLKVPTVAVLLVSMGCFGLGVLGLSYGALSASWDEDRVGSWFGFQEFTKNFRVLTASWRSLKKDTDPPSKS